LGSALSCTPAHWKSAPRIYGEGLEIWIAENYPCVFCGKKLRKLGTNFPAVDHVCVGCGEHYQIKATAAKIQKRNGEVKILGASLPATLASLVAENKWHLILIEYDRMCDEIRKIGLIFKGDISKTNIHARRPLGPKARRAGWQGCYLVFKANVVHFSYV
jgi:type II restriction enzyme